jgi:GNAT superfamily N-acetyltransferase
VAAIVNHAHDRHWGGRDGFFGFFDCEDDPVAAAGLLSAAELWLAARGRALARGPMNFSTNETCGQLVEGFETPPYVLTTWHPPYTARLLEGAGYRGVKELLGYMLHKDMVRTEKLRRVARIVERRTGVTIRNLDLARFDEELEVVQRIYNEGWSDHWGFVPMTEAEVRKMAADLRPVLLPYITFVAEVAGRPVGFALAIPEINRILRRIRGRLFPLGWLELLAGVKKLDTCRIVALGMLPEYQRAGLGTLFYLRLMEDGPGNGIDSGELSWVLEDNALMNRAAVEMGGRLYKRWRIYEKRWEAPGSPR